MVNLIQKRQERTALFAKAKALHDAAKKENRAFTNAEDSEYRSSMTRVAEMDSFIQDEERRQREEMLAGPAPRDPGPGRRVAAGGVLEAESRGFLRNGLQGEGFADFGDFVRAVRFPEMRENRELVMGVGASGGFMVPDVLVDQVFAIKPGASVIRPRARVIRTPATPDAASLVPSLDQSGANGALGGLTVTWIDEGDVKPETDFAMGQIKLEPHEVAAHVVVSDKLLRNAPAELASFLGQTLIAALLQAEDSAFIRGSGVGQPAGINGHPASIPVARTGPGTIVYADLVAMYARALFGGSLAWLGSPTILPQLMTLVGPGVGAPLVWQPNAREGAPGTLLGLPLLLSGRSPILGAAGDLMLVDLDYYLVKQGTGPVVQASPHPLFTSNRTIVKAFYLVDGQPWLTTPLLLEDGVTTVSPFVVLT